MFKQYSKPEGVGWLGWIEDATGKAVAFVGLDGRLFVMGGWMTGPVEKLNADSR